MSRAADPSQCPHHPRRPRRDRPLRRGHRRPGQALRRQHRDGAQVAQARPRGLPRPFGPAAPAALEGDRRGARGGLRAAPLHQLRPRRPHLRGQPLPAPPQPRQRPAHPAGRGVEPQAATLLGPAQEGRGPLQGLRPRLHPHRHQTGLPPGAGGFANEPGHPRREEWRRGEPDGASQGSSRRRR